MSGTQDTLDLLASLSTSQQLLRLAILVAPQVTIAAAATAGATFGTPAIVVLALSLVVALRPDSHGALAVTLALGWHWAAGVDDRVTPAALVGATGILALHAATAAATIAPPSAQLARETMQRWLRRTASVAAAPVALWATTRGFAALDTGGGVAAAVAGTAAVIGLIGLVRRDRA